MAGGAAQIGPLIDAGGRILDASTAQIINLIAVILGIAVLLALVAYLRDQRLKEAREKTAREDAARLIDYNKKIALEMRRANRLALAQKKALEARNAQTEANEGRFLSILDSVATTQQMQSVMIRRMDERQGQQVSEVQRLDKRIGESDDRATDGRREAVEALEKSMNEELRPIDDRLTAIEQGLNRLLKDRGLALIPLPEPDADELDTQKIEPVEPPKPE